MRYVDARGEIRETHLGAMSMHVREKRETHLGAMSMHVGRKGDPPGRYVDVADDVAGLVDAHGGDTQTQQAHAH